MGTNIEEQYCREVINDIIDDVLKIDHYSKIKLWEYNAKKAYNLLHLIKDSWKFLTPQQKISEAHTFYDIIFKTPSLNTGFVSKEIWESPRGPRGGFPPCTYDHVFNARTVIRILMDSWPSFMNNFDDFKIEFKKLLQTVGVTKKQNQDVKVRPNGEGEIIMNNTTKGRYSHITFVNVKTKEYCNDFPLEIPAWFNEGEIKRLKC